LSLHGLRRRLEALMMPDEPHVLLILDGAAEQHRRQRARGEAPPGSGVPS
jgi:hypothetical protein